VTLEHAQARCAYWQKVLRLQDWDVEVRIVRQRDMAHGGAAELRTSSPYRAAVLTLRDPIDFKPSESIYDGRMRDMEDSIVHELLHLHTRDLNLPVAAPDDESTPIEVAHERCIDAISAAMITLERQADERVAECRASAKYGQTITPTVWQRTDPVEGNR
jgi:hypothetical protein